MLDMDHAVRPGSGEMHQAHGLVVRASARPGDAGDRHGHLCLRPRHGALRHRLGHRLGHRAMGLDQGGGHGDQIALGGVAVGDEAPVDHGGRARHRRQRPGHQPARAALGRGDHQALGRGLGNHLLSKGGDIVGEHQGFPKRRRVGLDHYRFGLTQSELR
jgi:hypothetical protein